MRSISGTSKSGPSSDVEQRLLAGELLPGWDDGWVKAEREHFRQLRLHALEDLCADHRRSGRFADAYAWAAR